MFQVGGVLLLLFLTLILICCRRRKEKEREKEKEEGDTATNVDNDSGNNTAESCSDCEERKSLLTPLENKEEEAEAGLVEAQKPKFRSPLWLEDIHTNRLFNKQK